MTVRRFGVLALTLSTVLVAGMWLGGVGTGNQVWAAGEPTKGAEDPLLTARQLMADVMTDDAWVRARSLPPDTKLGPREALVLLKGSRQLMPQNPTTLRLLALSAAATDQIDQAADALKTLVRIDPENLVAQVDFLDLLVRGKPVDEQIKIYKSALAKTSFDPQVRSEFAVRIGKLYAQRGENDEATKYFALSLQLNDVNMLAWQEICSAQAKANVAPQEQLKTIIQLLWCNPYQPEALLAGARLCDNANAHKVAANWLVAVAEQYRLGGTPTPPEILLELSCELICANRLSEATAVLGELSGIENGPAIIPMLQQAIAQLAPTPAATEPKADPAGGPTPSAEDLVLSMKKRSAAGLAQDPKNIGSLGESLFIDYYFAPTPSEDSRVRLENLKSVTSVTDPVYLRLLGWQLVQQGKLAEAKALLEPLGGKDAFAALGLARIAELEKNPTQLAAALKQGWEVHPSGLSAVLISLEARKNNITLPVTAKQKAVEDVAQTYPERMLGMHRQPRDLLLLQVKGLKPTYQVGDPVKVNVNVLNTSDRAIYAGPGGAAGLSVGLGGTVMGVNATPLGIFAIDNFPRVYRLERKSSVPLPMRVDQGLLRDIMYVNLTRRFSVSLMMVTNPRSDANGVMPGLGGQKIMAGQFDRNGLGIGGREVMVKSCEDLSKMPVDKQMMLSSMFLGIVYNIPEDSGEDNPATGPASQPAAKHSMASTRQLVIDTLVNQVLNGPPLVQAWMLRYAPNKDIPAPITAAFEKLGDSPDPVVRMMWYNHELMLAGKDGVARAKLVPLLQEKAAKDKDPIARQWAELLAEEAQIKVPDQPKSNP